MTNFEAITKSEEALSRFLDVVQDDALEAEGCSFELTMPDEGARDWLEWLVMECYDPDGIMFLRGRVI